MSGGANSNATDHKIVVQNLAALAQVWVAPLDEGTEATVFDDGAGNNDVIYTLHKTTDGFTVDGFTVVAPIAGAPSAGAPGAVWVREFVCGLQQTTSVELLTDETTSSTSFVLIPGMILKLATIASPLGGILLIDFSAVLELNPDGALEVNPQAEATVGIFVDGVLSALASFNALNPIQFQVQPFVETVAITKRVPVGVPAPPSPAIPPGVHTIEARWKVNVTNAILNCPAATQGITPAPDFSPRFYMCLRAEEVSC